MAYELYAIAATRHAVDPRRRPPQDGAGAAMSRARARPGPARDTMNPAQPRVDRGDGFCS